MALLLARGMHGVDSGMPNSPRVCQKTQLLLFYFSPLDALQSHQRHQAAAGFSEDTQAPTAEMCLIFSVIMIPIPVLSLFF